MPIFDRYYSLGFIYLYLKYNIMKKLCTLITLFTFISHFAFAQDQDPKAKPILDDLSKTTKAYKSIVSEYIFTITSKEKKQIEKQKQIV